MSCTLPCTVCAEAEPVVCDNVIDVTIELLRHLARSEVDAGVLLHAEEALFFARAIECYAEEFEKAVDNDAAEVKAEWYVVLPTSIHEVTTASHHNAVLQVRMAAVPASTRPRRQGALGKGS